MHSLAYQHNTGIHPGAVINRAQPKAAPDHERIRDAVRAWSSALDNQDVVSALIINEYREQGGTAISFPEDISRARQKLFRFLDNPTLRYPATARSDTKYGFTAAIPNIQLNIWNGDTVQLPSRYLIATVEELDSQLWTVNSIKPNTDNTVSLTVAEYSDAIYQ
ncbi:toxin YdaT family protein [Enterobacter hormaechei]|uniref:toxin YdaT family protein n=1 Tax=Enterobacter hormaechei TaxID=158836 RepID=UPI00094181FF